MYTLAYSIQADPGRTLTPVLLDAAGTETGPAAVLQQFAKADWYGFTLSLPDAYRGFLAFRADDGTVTAMFAVNPQEAEYLDTRVSHASAGVGSRVVPLTIRSTQLQPVPGVSVWVTTDEGGQNTIAGTLLTDTAGTVHFLLDPGTYWVWRTHPTVTFENPKRLDVTDANP